MPGLGLSTPYVVVCFVCQGLDCQRLMSWFVLCARAWIVNALCRGLFCLICLGREVVARAWIVNALCRGLFCVLCLGREVVARVWIVNALCRGLFCVPGLGMSTPYVVVCFV